MRREVSDRLKMIAKDKAEKMRKSGLDVEIELIPTILVKGDDSTYKVIQNVHLDDINNATMYAKGKNNKILGRFTELQSTPTENRIALLYKHYGVLSTGKHWYCACCGEKVNTTYNGVYVCSSSCLDTIKQVK